MELTSDWWAFAQAGLKTGMYYLRTRAAADAIKFTVDQQALAKNRASRANSAASAELAASGNALKVRLCPDTVNSCP